MAAAEKVVWESLQNVLPFDDELIVDLFAGGGGASEAMSEALGREPDIAINHDRDAVDMHTVNHPTTQHLCEDIYEADPIVVTCRRQVGLLHLSPDCTDHSQAKGGQPRSKEIRSLTWVGLKWGGKVSPRIITLENVEQILKWGPLIAKRCPDTGRVVTLEKIVDPVTGKKVNRVAAPGERVPVQNQYLVGDPKRAGSNWRRFVSILRSMGYVVEWRKLKASDYGAGTSRERLFMMARRDGLPIVWPKPTHGKGRGLKPIVTAADCIDWSIKCPSIFTRDKPLVDATQRRIAKGIHKFVLNAADPFIVPVTHSGGERVHPGTEPLRTITTAQRGEFMVCAPSLVSVAHGDSGGRREYPVDDPMGTISAGGIQHAVVSAHLTKFRTGAIGSAADEPVPTICAGGNMKRPAGAAHAMGVVSAFLEQAHEELPGRDARDSLSTIVGKGCTQRLISATLTNFHASNTNGGRGDPIEPLPTILAGGTHRGLVECTLSPEAEEGALRVAAFLIRYYHTGGQWGDPRKPLHTLTTKERIALVTVHIKGHPFVIVDIGLRMLEPHELFKAQGMGPRFVFNRRTDGRPVSKTVQVRMVGNSVSPPPYKALLRANFKHEERFRRAA